MRLNQGVTTPTRTRKGTPDSVLVEAVDLARAAAEQSAPGEVGEHLDATAEDERLVTHRFATTNPAYRGWHWAVTLVRASRAKDPTVDEVVLLPGEGAVLAPPWVPWVERFQPGDLAPGDILPPPENDDRLVPGYTGEADAPYDPAQGRVHEEAAPLVADELGLGRPRVLSPVGRADTVDRWYSGDRGPDAPMATAAPAHCVTCGFQLPLAGSIGRVFGICANEYAPDDGRVVSFDHGCGAHSEVVTAASTLAERPPTVLDHIDYDLVQFDVEPAASAEPVGDDAPAADDTAAVPVTEDLAVDPAEAAEAAEVEAEHEEDADSDAVIEAVADESEQASEPGDDSRA